LAANKGAGLYHQSAGKLCDSSAGGSIKTVLITTAIFTGLAVTYLGAAAFLICSEPPAPADAVVLFIGPDNADRRKEARQLVQKGYADLLLAPALRRTGRNCLLSGSMCCNRQKQTISKNRSSPGLVSRTDVLSAGFCVLLAQCLHYYPPMAL